MYYEKSRIRTNKLYCTDCRKKLQINENVIFKLTEDRQMDSVYCIECFKKNHTGNDLLKTIDSKQKRSSDKCGHGQS